MFTPVMAGGIRYQRSQTQEVLLRTPQDALNLLAQGYDAGSALAENADRFQRFLFHETNFAPEFYDLKTGLAGEILQKFSNYCVKAAIVGSFESVSSPRFREFMGECNRGRQLFFAPSPAAAEAWIARV